MSFGFRGGLRFECNRPVSFFRRVSLGDATLAHGKRPTRRPGFKGGGVCVVQSSQGLTMDLLNGHPNQSRAFNERGESGTRKILKPAMSANHSAASGYTSGAAAARPS